MCYARRQRSSWARIKLSSKLYLNLSVKTLVSRACLALYTLLSMSQIRDRFEISFLQRNFEILNHKLCLYFNLLLFNCQWSARISPLFTPRFARLDYYTTSLSVCQEVFEKFFKFFSKTFSTAFQPERKCLSIIPHSLAFVKRFFKSFFNFFHGIFRSPPLSQFPALKRLAYYSTFISICQQVFWKFFEFGASGRCAQTKGKPLVQLAQ